MDRRVLWAIILMMAIAIAPTFFLKKPAPRPPASEPAPPATVGPAPSPTPLPQVAPDSSSVGDTVEVISPLYRYDFSTRGGHLVQATIQNYPSLAPADHRTPARLTPA